MPDCSATGSAEAGDVLSHQVVRLQRARPPGWKKNSTLVPKTSEIPSLIAPPCDAPRTILRCCRRPAAVAQTVGEHGRATRECCAVEDEGRRPEHGVDDRYEAAASPMLSEKNVTPCISSWPTTSIAVTGTSPVVRP